MNEQQFDRLLQGWLEVGPTELPDRSLAAALDATRHARQARRRPWTLVAGGLTRRRSIGLAIVVDRDAHGRDRGRDHRRPTPGQRDERPSPPPASVAPSDAVSASSHPSASVGPSPSPAPSPVPTAQVFPPTHVPAGVYDSERFEPPVRVTVPAAPTDTGDQTFDVLESPALFTVRRRGALGTYGFDIYRLGAPFADPCGPVNGPVGPSIESSLDAVVAHLRSIPELAPIDPVAVTIGGQPGLQFDLRAASGSCPNVGGDDLRGPALWPTDRGWLGAGGPYNAQTTRWTILVVDGQVLAIVRELNGQGAATYSRVVEAMIKSLEFR